MSILRTTCLIAGFFVMLGLSARATILTFGTTGSDTGGNIETIHQAYGDNVTNTTQAGYSYGLGSGFTPNIKLAYSHLSGAGDTGLIDHQIGSNDPSWGGGSTDYVDYLFHHDGTKFYLTFTPDAGYGVQVNSFLLEVYASGVAGSSLDWKLRQDTTLGAILSSGTQSGLALASDTPVSTGPTSYNGSLILELLYTGTANAGQIAIDDVNFQQFVAAVPEPATMGLVAVGGLMVWWRRRS